jgi:subfamily B ATP-binding cassette protein MsbA
VVRRKDLASPLSEFLGVSTVMFLLWYGSKLVFKGELGSDLFLSFLFAFYNVIDPVKNLSSAWYAIQKGRAAIERIEEVLETENTIVDPENPIPKTSFDTAIEYKNVTFYYPNSDKKILDNFSLIIPKGKVVALVGASGAGKSTIADLLPRFYDISHGQILIDNLNIQAISIQNLRSFIGIVSQEAILFNDSVEQNIRFGLNQSTENQVVTAAKVANAHTFIEQLEQGYDTNIGDRGSKLSGGQRQRLTIARAVLKDPPILILDEATSALDSESEQLVQAALNNMLNNRTAIIIAHRLSTIQNADLIVVLEKGKIVEQGSHDELMKANGEYRKLVAMQSLG